LRRFIDHQQGELRYLGVKIELGALIEDPAGLGDRFDVAVLATGAVANPVPEEFVHERVMSWFEVLNTGAPVPGDNRQALMVDDGSAFWWTYGVAEALTQAGWQVTVVTPSATVAAAIPHESVGPLLARLGRAGTRYRVLTTLYEVGEDGAHLLDVTSGEEEVVECGLVVVQTGRSPVNGLAGKLREVGMEFHTIGDCVTPRRMSHAVFEAHRLAGSL
jgi:2,4-dienoyl-CoA reductase (NADPH2)